MTASYKALTLGNPVYSYDSTFFLTLPIPLPLPADMNARFRPDYAKDNFKNSPEKKNLKSQSLNYLINYYKINLCGFYPQRLID